MNARTPEQEPIGARDDDSPVHSREDRSGSNMVRITVWAITMLAVLGYLAIGQIGAVWYRYNPFTQRVFREVDQRSIVDIWIQWLDELPQAPSEWALSALFVSAIVVVLVTVIWGGWLLLVSSGAMQPRARRQRQR